MLNRRRILVGAAVVPLLATTRVWGEAPGALSTSSLVYVTPLKSDGEESRCKAEVWFAHEGGSVFVVTAATAWRARAIAKGLTQARLWVGDYGVWRDSGDAFRQAPERMATAGLVTDADVQAQVLQTMGQKYADDGWDNWGPRFKTGLADGTRAMIRYALDS